MAKKLIPDGQEEQAILELLEGDYFIDGLGRSLYQVRSEDTDGNPAVDLLTVELDMCSDAHVHMIAGCTCRIRSFFGGGHHKRIHNALRILALAIATDADEGIDGAVVGE